MLKKMRWRVIGSSMGAIFAVLLILVLSINLWNYFITIQRLDNTLGIILDNEQREETIPFGDIDFAEDSFFGSPSPEANYMIRFFTVYCDSQGNILRTRRDYVASVEDTDAEEYASTILANGTRSGFQDEYRYLVSSSGDQTILVFLNASQELRSLRVTAFVSAVVFLVSLMAIFFLVFLFSGRAIAPYMKNIERQKQFITDASHELKTPLTAITTSADILAMEHAEDEWVSNIQYQTARLSKLVSNLVTLSRLDEETPLPEQTDFSLSQAVWEISEPFSSLAEAKGKTYSQSIEDGIVMHGDQAAIQQMVSILLDNAVKYSDPGGQIRLTVVRRHKRAVIEVFNTCQELDTANLNRLFDRFYRPDHSRSTTSGGNGIGLSIARATAEAHRGKITVSSRTGHEILFRVIL